MCTLWKRINGQQHTSSAKVVDGSLVLSLPDALTPVVWRMELGHVKASAMEVRASDNRYLLVLKTPKGEEHDIAPFESREHAVSALMQIANALEKADGRTKSRSGTLVQPAFENMAPPKSALRKWVVGALIVLALLFVFSSFFARVPAPATTTTDAPSAPQGESGVPLSADDYLRGF